MSSTSLLKKFLLYFGGFIFFLFIFVNLALAVTVTLGSGTDPGVVVEDVFSTYLYNGNGSTQTITNGIDLAGQGGLVWMKSRSTTYSHMFQDTVRGNGYSLSSDLTQANTAVVNRIESFNSNGFFLGAEGSTNANGHNYISWTFRKAPKFFDVVTWAGNSTAGRQINHSLGVKPGMIIIKSTNLGGTDWWVQHTSQTGRNALKLNTTDAQIAYNDGLNDPIGNSSSHTSTYFTLGDVSNQVNGTGYNYTAYLFAHDTATDGVIKCGSYQSASGVAVTLGWEPQWIIIKNAGAARDWLMLDTMRDMSLTNAKTIKAQSSAAEYTEGGGAGIRPTPTGFIPVGDISWADASNPVIYCAIRKGAMSPPTAASQLFKAVPNTGTGVAKSVTGFGFLLDMLISKIKSGNGAAIYDKLRGVNMEIYPEQTTSEVARSNTLMSFDMDGVSVGADGGGYINNVTYSPYIWWSFKRAPGVFDTVAYTGTDVARTVNHNLGVAPELIIIKSRNLGNTAQVYVSSLTAANKLMLFGGTGEMSGGSASDSAVWNNTSPTASAFTVGNPFSVNQSPYLYIAYLFATKAGISKVGSYTSDGTAKTIDVGFATTSKFVLIKRTDTTGDWYVYDSVRGIVTSGNDPYLLLNTNGVEVTNTNYIEPNPTGFTLNASTPINTSGGTYIYLALSSSENGICGSSAGTASASAPASNLCGTGTASSVSASSKQLLGWGWNAYGQIGSGYTNATTSFPTKIGTATTWSQVSAGGLYHSAGIKSNGTLWTWGYNGWGQLGQGDQVWRGTPTQVGSGTNWASVSAGSYHTAAIKTDGTLWTWGFGSENSLGLGADTTDRWSPTQVGSGTNWASVVAGNYYNVAIKTDGTLWVWGDNYYGQLGLNDKTDRNVPTQVGSGTNWSKVALGIGHVLAIKTDGTLWAWGYNGFGQLGFGDVTERLVPSTIGSWTDVNSVAAGYYHSAVTRSNGTLWAWGYGGYGQLGLNDTGSYSGKSQIGSATDTDWASVTAGAYNTFGIKTDRTLWAWGRNIQGKLGLGDTMDRLMPTQVFGGTNVISVSAHYHTLILKGSWDWTCSGSGGGINASCKAPVTPVNGTCGSAHGTYSASTPSSNLCSTGTANSVAGGTGDNLWAWACFSGSGGTSVSCGAPSADVVGQVAYTTPGTYSWTAPANVMKVSVVCVSGGQGGGDGVGQAGAGGRGGSLGYKNNIPVVPSQQYTVVVGAGGTRGVGAMSGGTGGSSSFGGVLSVTASVGVTYPATSEASRPISDGMTGADGGGLGGGTGQSAGGGAGGYAGHGGTTWEAPLSTSGAGGMGSRGSGAGMGGGGGGGVGLLGKGSTGTSYSSGSSSGAGGGGGSSGSTGTAWNGSNGGAGGLYGGGGGAGGVEDVPSPAGLGGDGACRIIWPGNTRQFPSTGTADQ